MFLCLGPPIGSFCPSFFSLTSPSSLSPDSFSPTSHSLAPGFSSLKPASTLQHVDKHPWMEALTRITGHFQHVLQQLSQAGICHGFNFPLVPFAWSKPLPSPSTGEVAGHFHQGFSPFLQDLLVSGQSLQSPWSCMCPGCSGRLKSSPVLGWVSLGWEGERFLEQLVCGDEAAGSDSRSAQPVVTKGLQSP